MIQIINIELYKIFKKWRTYIGFIAIAVLIPLMGFVTIFIYKKRRIQLRLTIFLLILEILLIVAGVIYAANQIRMNSGSVTLPIRIGFPIVEIILTFLAYRSIRHDEDLVRSYDRLR